LMVIPISHEGDVTVKCDIDIDICIFLSTLFSAPKFRTFKYACDFIAND